MRNRQRLKRLYTDKSFIGKDVGAPAHVPLISSVRAGQVQMKPPSTFVHNCPIIGQELPLLTVSMHSFMSANKQQIAKELRIKKHSQTKATVPVRR